MMSYEVPHDQREKAWEWQKNTILVRLPFVFHDFLQLLPQDERVVDMSVGGTGNEEVEEVASALVDSPRSAGETPVQDREESVP
jgi:hypothetical protein